MTITFSLVSPGLTRDPLRMGHLPRRLHDPLLRDRARSLDRQPLPDRAGNRNGGRQAAPRIGELLFGVLGAALAVVAGHLDDLIALVHELERAADGTA